MIESHSSNGRYSPLVQATTILLLFQAAVLIAQELGDSPHSGSMTGLLAATVVLSVVNRRLATDPQGRHASGYVIAWRYGALAFLGVLSVLIAVRTYAPEVTPDGTPTMIALLLAALIALKGAMLGKLKPGGVLGLRLPWTCQSRLAWEKAHRLMGRILFFGGLLGVVTAPFVSFVAVFIWVAGVILAGVTAGAIESRRVWKTDPERRVAA